MTKGPFPKPCPHGEERVSPKKFHGEQGKHGVGKQGWSGAIQHEMCLPDETVATVGDVEKEAVQSLNSQVIQGKWRDDHQPLQIAKSCYDPCQDGNIDDSAN